MSAPPPGLYLLVEEADAVTFTESKRNDHIVYGSVAKTADDADYIAPPPALASSLDLPPIPPPRMLLGFPAQDADGNQVEGTSSFTIRGQDTFSARHLCGALHIGEYIRAPSIAQFVPSSNDPVTNFYQRENRLYLHDPTFADNPAGGSFLGSFILSNAFSFAGIPDRYKLTIARRAISGGVDPWIVLDQSVSPQTDQINCMKPANFQQPVTFQQGFTGSPDFSTSGVVTFNGGITMKSYTINALPTLLTTVPTGSRWRVSSSSTGLDALISLDPGARAVGIGSSAVGTNNVVVVLPTTFSDTTTFGNRATFNSGATLNGSATLNSSLSVSGSATFGTSGFTSSGTATFGSSAATITAAGAGTFQSVTTGSMTLGSFAVQTVTINTAPTLVTAVPTGNKWAVSASTSTSASPMLGVDAVNRAVGIGTDARGTSNFSVAVPATFANSATLLSSLTVSGLATLNGGATIAGTSTLNNVSISGTTTATGLATMTGGAAFGASAASISAAGAGTFASVTSAGAGTFASLSTGTLAATGLAAMTGGATFGASAASVSAAGAGAFASTSTGTLTVSGASSLAGLQATNASFTTLTVSAATSLQGGATISGTCNLSTVNITGSMSANAGASFAGGATIGSICALSAVTVSGSATFSSGFTVSSGTATFGASAATITTLGAGTFSSLNTSSLTATNATVTGSATFTGIKASASAYIGGTGSSLSTLYVNGTMTASGLSTLSDVSITGTLSVTSSAQVNNLNAQYLGGQQGSYYTNAGNMSSGTLGVARGGTGSATLAANKLLVGNDTGALLVPTELHWDNTNKRLAIGTSTPTQALHVVGDAFKSTGGTSWASSSDSRIKTQIQVADEALLYDVVRRLPLKRYRFDESQHVERDMTQLGFIAQDVERFFPKSVQKMQLHGYEDFRTVNTDQLYKAMWGALRHLADKVEALEKNQRR